MASQPASPTSATSGGNVFATQAPEGAEPGAARPGTGASAGAGGGAAHLSATEHEGTTAHRMKEGLELAVSRCASR